MNKRRVQLVPPGGAIVGTDGVHWEGRMLVTARCGHQFQTSARPTVDLCIATERLLDHHEGLCTPWTRAAVFSVRAPQPAQRVTALEM